jgi:hypothetical protein
MIVCLGCATKVPLSSNYFKSENAKKVGLIININKISVTRNGAQGVLEMVATPGNKFKEALYVIENEVNPKEKLKKMYIDIFASKGKILVFSDETLDPNKLKPFDAPDSQKKYSKNDFRYLKMKYNLDEILLIDVDYGMLLSYYSFAVINRQTFINIRSEIINLSDNSLFYKDNSRFIADLNKTWDTPPSYNNLKLSLEDAILNVTGIEKGKYANSQ